MRILYFICTLIGVVWIACPAFGQVVQLKEKVVRIGEDSVVIQKYRAGSDSTSYCFIHVHENETASLEAGFRMLLKYGGMLVTIRHSEPGMVNRNIQFKIQNEVFEFDPNRIFTKDTAVLNKTLFSKTNNVVTRDSALNAVQHLADAIVEELKDHAAWVALHNNKNTPAKWALIGKEVEVEAESYSIVSYIKKFDEASESSLSASDLYINPAINNSEFFIATNRHDFEALSKRRYSVVLQNDKPVDDGSLSVYAITLNKRYINAEAKHGKVDEQFQMLEIWHQVVAQTGF